MGMRKKTNKESIHQQAITHKKINMMLMVGTTKNVKGTTIVVVTEIPTLLIGMIINMTGKMTEEGETTITTKIKTIIDKITVAGETTVAENPTIIDKNTIETKIGAANKGIEITAIKMVIILEMKIQTHNKKQKSISLMNIDEKIFLIIF